jgi:hypothetical protein
MRGASNSTDGIASASSSSTMLRPFSLQRRQHIGDRRGRHLREAGAADRATLGVVAAGR